MDSLKYYTNACLHKGAEFYGSYIGRRTTSEKIVIASCVGVGVALAGVPLFIYSVGFTSGGISAGSLGAYAMSLCAPVGKGTLIALGQSAGYLGTATITKLIVGFSGAASTYVGTSVIEKSLPQSSFNTSKLLKNDTSKDE